MFSQFIQKSARAIQIPRIRMEAEQSGLQAMSEAWSVKIGCLGGPQQRQYRHSLERWNHQ